MIVCKENFQHIQELQKQYHDKYAKPRSYAPGKKVWLNSKYTNTKRNRKLKAKFFRSFRVLHPVRKQAYKLELLKKWKIHNVYHMSLLKQDTTRKARVDEMTSRLKFENEGDGKEYKIETICNSAVYVRELESHLSCFYYLVSWKDYPKEENTLEPTLPVIHLRKLINNFYHDYPEKPIATSPPIDSAPAMARPTVKSRADTSSK